MLISVELPIPEIQVNTTPVWIKKLSIWSIGGLPQIKEVWHVNRKKNTRSSVTMAHRFYLTGVSQTYTFYNQKT